MNSFTFIYSSPPPNPPSLSLFLAPQLLLGFDQGVLVVWNLMTKKVDVRFARSHISVRIVPQADFQISFERNLCSQFLLFSLLLFCLCSVSALSLFFLCSPPFSLTLPLPLHG